MTINNILNEMASSDVNGINDTDSVESIANKYIENYKKRSGKEFSDVAAGVSRKSLNKIILDKTKLNDIILSLKSKAKSSNPTNSNAQSRVAKGTSVEAFLLSNTKNTIKKSGNIGPLIIDGKNLNDILDSSVKDLKMFSIPEKCSISISFANKMDLKVDDTIWRWNDNSPVKDIKDRTASSSTSPIYIESKAGNGIVNGTMAFELGKVSTHREAYKILNSLNLMPYNEHEAYLLKQRKKTDIQLTPQEVFSKKVLQEKIIHMLSGNTMQDDMGIAKEIFDKIVADGRAESVLNANIKTLKNHFLIISNLAGLQDHKVTSLTCMANNSISLKTTKGWQGFYKLNGDLVIKENFIDNNLSSFLMEMGEINFSVSTNRKQSMNTNQFDTKRKLDPFYDLKKKPYINRKTSMGQTATQTSTNKNRIKGIVSNTRTEQNVTVKGNKLKLTISFSFPVKLQEDNNV